MRVRVGRGKTGGQEVSVFRVTPLLAIIWQTLRLRRTGRPGRTVVRPAV